MMVKHGHDFDYVSCGGVDPFALVMLFEEGYSAGVAVRGGRAPSIWCSCLRDWTLLRDWRKASSMACRSG
jgi:hypothetical protein